MYSPSDPHSAPVGGSHIWPQSSPELPRCGQISSTVPVVQDQGRGELLSQYISIPEKYCLAQDLKEIYR